jgi:hypothetical protein
MTGVPGGRFSAIQDPARERVSSRPSTRSKEIESRSEGRIAARTSPCFIILRASRLSTKSAAARQRGGTAGRE